MLKADGTVAAAHGVPGAPPRMLTGTAETTVAEKPRAAHKLASSSLALPFPLSETKQALRSQLLLAARLRGRARWK